MTQPAEQPTRPSLRLRLVQLVLELLGAACVVTAVTVWHWQLGLAVGGGMLALLAQVLEDVL